MQGEKMVRCNLGSQNLSGEETKAKWWLFLTSSTGCGALLTSLRACPLSLVLMLFLDGAIRDSSILILFTAILGLVPRFCLGDQK